jgi:hypothetical protein
MNLLFNIEQQPSESRVRSKHENFAISRNKKVDGDFYATPPAIMRALLKKEVMEGEIWEPACGDGKISEMLKEFGYDVYSSDLFARGYGDVLDFLNTQRACDTIITNPPFDKIDLFLIHSKKLAKKKIVFIASQNFLKGKNRITTFLLDKEFPLTKVYLMDTSINFYKNGLLPKTRTGFMTSCVCVFEKVQKDYISLDFLRV